MAASATTSTTPPATKTSNDFISTAIGHAAFGAFSAWAFTAINPAAGALFAVTATWGSHIVESLTETLKCMNDTTCGKAAAFALKWLGGIGLGVLATSLLGFPLTFNIGLILVGSWIATSLAMVVLGIGVAAAAHTMTK